MKRIIFITALCAFVAAPAMADLSKDLMVDYVNVGPGLALNLTLGASTGNYRVGVYNLDISQSGSLALDGVGVDSFCIDIADATSTNNLPYSAETLNDSPDPLAGPMGVTKAQYLASALNKYWTGPFASTTAGNTAAAALQLAVWEIVSDTLLTWNIYSGNIKANTVTNASTAAQAILNDVKNNLGRSSYGAYYGLVNVEWKKVGTEYKWVYGVKQDYVVKVPVPAAVLLGMLGLSVAGLKLRKFA